MSEPNKSEGEKRNEQEEATPDGLPKYRYLEDFKEKRDPETGKPLSGIGSPAIVETELYGKLILHRIAKIDWQESKVTQEFPDGTTREYSVYEESLGELGGWVEGPSNLAHHGKCWIEAGAVVCGDAHVSGDAIIKSEVEIGDYAQVSGEAEISGPAGIGNDAVVFGSAKVVGKRYTNEAFNIKDKKVFTVYGEASVEGEVSEGGSVYGEAVVGPEGKVTNGSKVYGEAVVDGEVTDESEVYGRAEVYGLVNKAYVYGTAVVGKDGSVVGADATETESGVKVLHHAIVRYGTIDGELAGESYVRTAGGVLYIGKGAHVEKCTIGAGMYYLGEDCYLYDCRFNGLVNLVKVTAQYCEFTDTVAKECELEGCEATRTLLEEVTAHGEMGQMETNDGEAPIVSVKAPVVFVDAISKKGTFTCTYKTSADPSQDEQVVTDRTEKGWHIETKSNVSEDDKIARYKSFVQDGIVPEGADWHNVSMSGVTDITNAVEIGLTYGVTKGKDVGKGTPITAIPHKVHTYSYDKVVWKWDRDREEEVQDTETVEGVFNIGTDPDFDRDTQMHPLWLAELNLHGAAWDAETAGLRRYEDIAVYSEETNEWQMKKWLEKRKKAEDEAVEKKKKLLERKKYVKDVKDGLSERYDTLSEQMRAIYSQMDNSGDPSGSLSKQASDLDNRRWLIRIAQDVVSINLDITPMEYDTDNLWERKKAAVDATVESLGGSVTPHFAFTPLYAITDPTEKWPRTKFEGDEGKGYSMCIPDFTKPRTLPAISKLGIGDNKMVWIISEFDPDIIWDKFWSVPYAEYYYADKNLGDASFCGNGPNLVRYTEYLKYGMEKFDEYLEKDESSDSDSDDSIDIDDAD